MTKNSFQFQQILKQVLISFYLATELKQSTHNFLKDFSFLEIILPLLTVTIVELHLLSFKQNRSVTDYFLNGFSLIHYSDWQKYPGSVKACLG